MDISLLVKPFTAGVVGGLLDKYVLKNGDMKHNAYFAGSLLVGCGIANLINQSTDSVQQDMMGNSKGLLQRAVEIASGAGAGYVINTYLLKNQTYKDINYTGQAKIVGIIAISVLAGEIGDDLFSGRSLEMFA